MKHRVIMYIRRPLNVYHQIFLAILPAIAQNFKVKFYTFIV